MQLLVPDMQRIFRQLSQLPDKTIAKIVRTAMRKSIPIAHSALIENLSGRKVKIHTGRLLAAMRQSKLRSYTRKGRITVGFELPKREDLQISADAEWYYPSAVEYGYTRTKRAPVTVTAKRPMRDAIDEHLSGIEGVLSTELKLRLFQEWRKVFPPTERRIADGSAVT